MTEQETRELLMTIDSMYPNFKVENPEFAVKTWHWALEDYPAEGIMGALQIYVKTNNTGFAPSASQLIGAMHSVSENDRLTEGEAWDLVKRAIQDGNYHAEERFNELPPLVRRAVGSANMIHQWAGTDSDEVNTVIMSNFQRTYRAMASKQSYYDKVPDALQDVVRNVAESLTDRARVQMIEVDEDEMDE